MKTIYTNGNIITLEDYSGNALVEENGKIIDIGDYQKLYKKGMKIVDLKGHTLIPAFIDSHSHVVALAKTLNLVDLTNTGCS